MTSKLKPAELFEFFLFHFSLNKSDQICFARQKLQQVKQNQSQHYFHFFFAILVIRHTSRRFSHGRIRRD